MVGEALWRADDMAALADAIIKQVGNRVVLALPLGTGKANHVANALYQKARDDPRINLEILTALSPHPPRPDNELERRFIAPISERLFDGYPLLDYAQSLHGDGLPANITVSEFFLQPGQWMNVAAAQRDFIYANYTHVVRALLDRDVNVLAQAVAREYRADGEVRYSLSSNTDLTLDLLPALEKRRRAGSRIALVGQVNSELPFMPGDGDLPASTFDFIVDDPACDFALFAPPRNAVSMADHAAGAMAACLVEDGGTLQVGIGSIGDALCNALLMRHTRTEAFRSAIQHLDPVGNWSGEWHDAPFQEGLFAASEMLVAGFLPLFDAGVLTREAHDGAVAHCAFFLAHRDFYRTLREMPRSRRARLHMRAVSKVNEIYDDVSRQRELRKKARFVNNCMMVTLLGAVVSDGLEDGRMVSGVGGQYNFIAQAFALEDARSIVIVNATREARGRLQSNIVWQYGHVTIPRHLRDIVVTEYGVADLRGRTDRDVIAALLEVSDARFQHELLREARKAGKIEAGYSIPDRSRRNTPEYLRDSMREARRDGLFDRFPFGSDFTASEQRLVPALEHLRALSRSRLDVLRALIGSLRAHGPDAEEAACLERMELTTPDGLRERVWRALVLDGLRATQEQAR